MELYYYPNNHPQWVCSEVKTASLVEIRLCAATACFVLFHYPRKSHRNEISGTFHAIVSLLFQRYGSKEKISGKSCWDVAAQRFYMATLLHSAFVGHTHSGGTLGSAPINGGNHRCVLEIIKNTKAFILLLTASFKTGLFFFFSSRQSSNCLFLICIYLILLINKQSQAR